MAFRERAWRPGHDGPTPRVRPRDEVEADAAYWREFLAKRGPARKPVTQLHQRGVIWQ